MLAMAISRSERGEMTMKKKAKKSTPIPTKNPEALIVEQQSSETAGDALAHTALRPTVQAALTVRDYSKVFGEMDINTLVADLGKQCDLASGGDLGRTEALLIAQAHTLDAIFHMLARKAVHCEYLNQLDVNLRLALKAQSQCRATLETSADIKNPQPVAFVRQANISHGPQQVNNGTVRADEPPRAGEIEIPQNKLLESQDGKRLDAGTAGAAGDANSRLETVEAVHRADDASR